MRVDLQEKITIKSTAESMCLPITKLHHSSPIHTGYLCAVIYY